MYLLVINVLCFYTLVAIYNKLKHVNPQCPIKPNSGHRLNLNLAVARIWLTAARILTSFAFDSSFMYAHRSRLFRHQLVYKPSLFSCLHYSEKFNLHFCRLMVKAKRKVKCLAPKRNQRPKRGKYIGWTEEAMVSAVSAVTSGAVSQRKASSVFGVPRCTLHTRVTGKTKTGAKSVDQQRCRLNRRGNWWIVLETGLLWVLVLAKNHFYNTQNIFRRSMELHLCVLFQLIAGGLAWDDDIQNWGSVNQRVLQLCVTNARTQSGLPNISVSSGKLWQKTSCPRIQWGTWMKPECN